MRWRPDDVVAPMHRDLGAYLLRGLTPQRVFGNLLGRANGVSGGRDANLHGMGDLKLNIIGFISHLPHSLPVALGAAMSFVYRGEARVALAFTGDGSSSAGLFHETLNMAAVWNAPLVIMVENNQYAYSTPLTSR
jgi:TPP-dependent pyruvate/acetoin dehydrogenase alpha subunit